ncbi:uncharacterized protein LODBEIA_P28620 [Lodderomyces beijingensis]|uniref:Trehalose-phosphatase n=1 Tax=Lodderomyces beijingensis TaxID=1775926 RepID=A0ABP0ZKG7_9ASCO
MPELDQLKVTPADGHIVSPADFAQNDKVQLSGRIINVMTTLPTQIVSQYDSKSEQYRWDVELVRGNSALFSSQSFLSQHSDWETHLVAWTGELKNKSENTFRLTAEELQDDPLYLDEEDKHGIEEKVQSAIGSKNIHPVWLLRRDQERWRKYAEHVLWPVFHYFEGTPSDGKAEIEAWHDYVKFNEAYLNKIKSIYQPGDIIWIHDYYLLLLPQLLRMEFPDAYIGHFLHVPFPSSEYFKCLSKRTQLLDGMLGSDKIGFQSESFQRHFLSCCARVLGCEVTKSEVFAYGRTLSLETLPIGIDTLKTQQEAFTADVTEKVKAISNSYKDMKIIVGRDRLDKVRGVLQKLQAFQIFLDMYPEWREKVVLIQVSSPGYQHSANVELKVTELINQINSKYGTLNYAPVIHYQMMVPKDEYLALLRVADLCLITSVRDGMNTTAMEFVICQKDKGSPLILSEFTGTASVLKDAILVNPWDSVGISKTVNDALKFSDGEKKYLEDKLFAKVSSNTIQHWTSQFIRDTIEHAAVTHANHYTPALNRPLLLKNYEESKRRLFLFDYDGTLTPIVQDPAAAIPSDKLNRVLDTLAQDPKNQIWIISGRDQAFLEKWMGKKNIGLSAEHGCFMRDPGEKYWLNLAEKFDMSWQEKVKDVFEKYTKATPGSSIEIKKVAITWHYRRADPELGAFQSDQCLKELLDTVAKDYDVDVMAGKANLEVRPKFLNKGEIVKTLVLHPHGAKQAVDEILENEIKHNDDELPDFVLCVGDDLTDEDMFKSLLKIENQWNLDAKPKNKLDSYGVFPVAVGPASKKTVATAHLNEPAQVLETLGLLAGQVSLFESAGSVELDDRGHVANSESSTRSKDAIVQAHLRRKKSTDLKAKAGSSSNTEPAAAA